MIFMDTIDLKNFKAVLESGHISGSKVILRIMKEIKAESNPILYGNWEQWEQWEEWEQGYYPRPLG